MVFLEYVMYGLTGSYISVLKYKDITKEERMNLKRKFREDFTNGLYYTEDNINYAIAWMMEYMKSNIVLKLDITSEEYDPFDTDEAKSHEKEEFINRMYLGYITSIDKVESFNMHTKSGVGVDKEKISKVTINDDDSTLSILKEIYKEEKEKDNGLEFAFLDRFMNYVNSMDQDIKL